MNTYDNNNSGSLFKNDRKQTPNQPDYTGTAIIEGKALRVSAWVKTSRDGTKKFLSLAFNEPTQAYVQQPANAPAPAPRPAAQDDMPEELMPF